MRTPPLLPKLFARVRRWKDLTAKEENREDSSPKKTQEEEEALVVERLATQPQDTSCVVPEEMQGVYSYRRAETKLRGNSCPPHPQQQRVKVAT